MFPYSNRQMHVEQTPDEVFPNEYLDFSNCSKIGKFQFFILFRNTASRVGQIDSKEQTSFEATSRPQACTHNLQTSFA